MDKGIRLQKELAMGVAGASDKPSTKKQVVPLKKGGAVCGTMKKGGKVKAKK
jgi:hypothetical protein